MVFTLNKLASSIKLRLIYIVKGLTINSARKKID